MSCNKKGKSPTFTDTELEKILACDLLTLRDRVFFEILIATGCGILEACKIRWMDVSCDEIRFVRYGKKNKSVINAPVNEKLSKLILEYREYLQTTRNKPKDYRFVFSGKRIGSHLCPSTVHKIFNNVTDYLGMQGFSLYSFKRTSVRKILEMSRFNIHSTLKQTNFASIESLENHIGYRANPVKALVYFVKYDEFYKIGVTTRLKTRLSTIQTSLPKPLALTYKTEYLYYELAYAIENELHKFFCQKHAMGEWFELDDLDLVEAINICKSMIRFYQKSISGSCVKKYKKTIQLSLFD